MIKGRKVYDTLTDTYPLGFVADSTEKKEMGCFGFGINEYGGSIQYAKPSYQPGDILYVRETWKKVPNGYYYYEDWQRDDIADVTKWKPSIHMPKEAARIWLKVTDVKVERLQEITEVQAQAEGCNSGLLTGACTARGQFEDLWNSTIKKSDLDRYGWEANPCVFVIEFVKIDKPEEIQNA